MSFPSFQTATLTNRNLINPQEYQGSAHFIHNRTSDGLEVLLSPLSIFTASMDLENEVDIKMTRRQECLFFNKVCKILEEALSLKHCRRRRRRPPPKHCRRRRRRPPPPPPSRPQSLPFRLELVAGWRVETGRPIAK